MVGRDAKLDILCRDQPLVRCSNHILVLSAQLKGSQVHLDRLDHDDRPVSSPPREQGGKETTKPSCFTSYHSHRAVFACFLSFLHWNVGHKCRCSRNHKLCRNQSGSHCPGDRNQLHLKKRCQRVDSSRLDENHCIKVRMLFCRHLCRLQHTCHIVRKSPFFFPLSLSLIHIHIVSMSDLL